MPASAKTFLRAFDDIVGLVLTWVLTGMAFSAAAVPPPNDNCAGAEIIPTAGPFPYYTSIVDVKDATATNDPPAPSCPAVSVTRSVWYEFTPPNTQLYTISASGDTATTVLDTVMAIYTSSGGCGGPFVQFACNDDAGDCQSAISTTFSANVTYYIVVWMSSVSPPVRGMTSLQLRVSRPVPPPNDNCAGAEVIPGNGPFPYSSSIADTTLAATSGNPVPSCWPAHVRSIWFSFTPAMAGSYEFSLCTDTGTTVYETVMAIYTSANGCAGPFAEVYCNHTNSCSYKPRSAIQALLNSGLTYYIVAWEGINQAYTPGETSLQLRVLVPPVAATLPASSLTSTSAVLNALVNPNGLSTSVWFEWGSTTNYGTTTAAISIPGASGSVAIADPIGGLLPGHTNHFRVVANNGMGPIAGEDRTFAWSPARPRFTSSTMIGSSFVIQFTGQAGQLYSLQSSPDLARWTDLGTASDLGGGLFRFIAMKNSIPGFYRVRSP